MGFVGRRVEKEVHCDYRKFLCMCMGRGDGGCWHRASEH